MIPYRLYLALLVMVSFCIIGLLYSLETVEAISTSYRISVGQVHTALSGVQGAINIIWVSSIKF